MVYTRTIGGTKPGVFLSNVMKDHLGSTDVVLVGEWTGSSFTNQTTEFQSFDAWGERRDASTQVNYRAADADPFHTSDKDYDRGYTGHEQLDDSGLIHMNGRIYDPELGRFLSPDPVVQIPEYSQNFNRYSYVLNNPLNATDPSGFSFLSKVFSKVGSWVKENWRTIVVIAVAFVVTALTAGVAGSVAYAITSSLAASGVSAATAAAIGTAVGLAAAGAIIGAVTGGLSAALHGGDAGDILRGALVQGISGALTGPLHMAQGLTNIVGHGIVGGVTNVAMGGKFSDGFISAAAGAATAVAGLTSPNTQIGQSLGIAGRTAIASAVGGTASVIGGGKFANGAFTAAFQHLVNAEGGSWLNRLDRAMAPYSVEIHAAAGAPPDWVVDLGEGAGATLDGWVPFADPIGEGGGYDYSDHHFRFSRTAGAFSRDFALMAYGNALFATKSGFFWGGGGVTIADANAAANAVGSRTLGQTIGGRIVGRLDTFLQAGIRGRGLSPQTTYKYLWKPASVLFAGNTQKFGGRLGPGGHIWKTIEAPILKLRGLIP